MAAISLHSPFCIAGITFLTAIPATPSTPHLTFCSLILRPRFIVVVLLACTHRVGACRAVSFLEFFFGTDRFQVRDAVDAKNAIEMLDLVLEEFGKVSQLASLNLMGFPL